MSLAVKNVHFHYRGSTVLNGITHQFLEGSITAVLGKSGSGKSTLLQLLNGMLRPDDGEVLWFGKSFDYRHAYRVRRKIGYVIQSAGLFPHMTLEANIAIGGRASGLEKKAIDARISDLLQKVSLPQSYRSKYPHELSGGEQQRAGLCRALLLNPPVLLMDEPFASLDFHTRLGIYQYMVDIQSQEPRTIVLVTHDLQEGARLADRFIWIEEGRIKDEGGKDGLERRQSQHPIS